ncbi:uncharacterized protein N7511_006952 [Penicillium nucicola]|uniref:uncharacterized protein n=1 Tax=Penicillium nucicola TaxID=1850975 RepID=UPI0025455036|nr:uncharacterized protein N7511_006952 [Penicillium nucicola]KAJ5758258.1 hypothetical protein N7511_006952 [Penicillium nucicola]
MVQKRAPDPDPERIAHLNGPKTPSRKAGNRDPDEACTNTSTIHANPHPAPPFMFIPVTSPVDTSR